MADATDRYSKEHEHAGTILTRIEKILSSALEHIGNPDLVKAALEKPRMKRLEGVLRKAKERGWEPEEAIEKCRDFVGLRVVCNNLQDAYRAADLFEQALTEARLAPERKDYIENPKATGYRAIHLLWPVRIGFAGEEMTLGCELQIRTRLQDGWSRLSRADLYRKNIRERLRNRMEELAEMLSRADKIAEEIRQEVSRPRAGEMPEPGAPLT